MPKFIFDKNYSVFIPARKDWTYDEIVLNDDVICYTDGSRFEHIGTSGAGIYNCTDNVEVLLPLGHNTSVFQAEVYAIAQCAKMENLLHRNNSSIAICSDSLSAIQAVSAAKVTTGTVADAMQALKTLAIYNSVRLVWVPGHSGVEGNERADLLAKEAASTPFIGPEPSLGISTTTLRSSLYNWADKEQTRLWKAQPGCRQAKLFLTGLNRSLTRYALRLDRRHLRILSGLLTGHGSLNRHLKVMGLKQDALCPLCQEEDETPVHFIAQCSATALLRMNIFAAYTLPVEELPNIHWSALLRFTTASKRILRP